MKKITLLSVVLLMCMLFCACGNAATQTAAPTETVAPTPEPTLSPESIYAEVKSQYPSDGTVGFYTEDLDGDGVKELFVGNLTGDIYAQQVIDAMYTVQDGEAVKVFESTGDDKYYLTENGTVAKETIENAFKSEYSYYTYANGNLELMVNVIFNMTEDKENPWYQEIAGQKETLEEQAAMDFIQAYQNTYRNLEYST